MNGWMDVLLVLGNTGNRFYATGCLELSSIYLMNYCSGPVCSVMYVEYTVGSLIKNV